MKKKLIIVGNKENVSDCSKEIDSFDFVVRINRMNNYGLTGTKTDGLYIGTGRDFVFKFDGGEHKDIIKTIPNIFILNSTWQKYFNEHWKKYMTQKQIDNIEFCDIEDCRKRMMIPFPCSTVFMIDYFSHNKKWCDEYEIWFTGIDVDNRKEILSTGKPWKYTPHMFDGEIEENYLKKLLNKKIVKMI